MEELTIEQKARRYDEAIKRAKSKIKKDKDHVLYEDDIIDIFPELAESEDEKIRKELIKLVEESTALREVYDLRKMSAWLEKQGEQKVIIPKFRVGDVIRYDEDGEINRVIEIVEEGYKLEHGTHILCFPSQDNWELVEQKPADNEPKFHKGDWIVHYGTENIYQVVAVIGNHYQLKYGNTYTVQNCADVDRCARLWDITKDARDGDVLVDGNLPFIFKKIDTNKYSYAYCGISVDDGFKIESDGESGEWTWMQDIKPATQEQHDTLIKAMTDAGYTFDFEKKELKKIEQKIQPKFEVGDVMRSLKEAKEGITDGLPVVVSIDEEYYHCNNELISIKDQDKYEYPPMNRKQKPAEWTAEDENQRINTIGLVKNANDCAGILDKETALNWLNDIKDRFVPQSKQEWSEEDEKMLKWLCRIVHSQRVGKVITLREESELGKWIDKWLNHNPQPHWKPSDEQLNSLYDILNPCDGLNRDMLESLYNDLKKLKE